MCNLSQGFVDMGRKEGRAETRKETALRMLADGLNVQKVSEYSGLSIESVEKLALET